MESRERVRRILNHQVADRPAIDLGSSEVTSTSAWTYAKLREALGLPPKPTRVFNLIQMLAEVDADVQDALGADVAMLPPDEVILGGRYGDWKPYTFPGGQTFDVPVGFHPVAMPGGSLEVGTSPEADPTYRLPPEGRFFDVIPDKQGDPFDVPLLPRDEWRFVDELEEDNLRAKEKVARDLYSQTDRAIMAQPPVFAPLGHGGLYNWAIVMMTEPAYAEDYMMAQAEATARCYEQYLQAVGDHIDVLIISLADFGLQHRELFRPALFERFFVPAWQIVTETVHCWPNVSTWIHCCGSVPNLLGHFVEAGVDCLNPIQWTADGMDLARLKQAYGDRLVFWGGAVSTQGTLPFGTPEEVAAEAECVLDTMTPEGGYVFNPIHNILPEVPIENILALFKTAQNYTT
jgi:hypothetical protein